MVSLLLTSSHKDMVEDLRNLSQAFELENRTNQRQHYQGTIEQSNDPDINLTL